MKWGDSTAAYCRKGSGSLSHFTIANVQSCNSQEYFEAASQFYYMDINFQLPLQSNLKLCKLVS